MADVFTIIGTVIAFITLLTGSILYWVEQKKVTVTFFKARIR